MNYYVKNRAGQGIHGPYAIEEINAKIAAGDLGCDPQWLATSDLGESIDSVRAAPPRDWVLLSSLPGVCPDSGVNPDAHSAEPSLPSVHCPKCKSARVIEGKILDYGGRFNLFGRTASFRPNGIRFRAMTVSTAIGLSDASFGCLDCGLVWSSTEPNELAEFYRKNCKQQ